MCAIKPVHKKRIIFDFYTSHPMNKGDFEHIVLEYALKAEIHINKHGDVKVHVKETEQEAD